MSHFLAEEEHSVSPLELFFDLVFVFAFTQVTTLLVRNPTWSGLGHALLIMGVLWWIWSSFAWLTNTVDANVGLVLGAVMLSAAAMFIAALAVPGAFGSDGVIFGVAFLIVAVVLVTLYTVAAAGNPDFLTAILRLVPWVLGGALLILVAGLVEGRYRDVFWVAALVAGFFGPALISVRGWRVQPGHFVERHGLIIIIAIGESLAAIGLGARGLALTGGVIMGAVLGFVVAASFWLAYFDFFSVRGRRLLDDRHGDAQVELARDVYTYLHLPMVVGIVLFAFGMKGTLAHLHTPLGTVEAVALCGGSALYLGAYVALRFRVSRRLGRGRITAAIACALLVPVAHHIAALTALTLLAAVWVALHAYELIWWRVERAETRAQTT